MNDNLIELSGGLPWPWLVANGLLALACGWWLWRSPIREHKLVRALLTTLALLALTALGLNWVRSQPYRQDTALLLTAGATDKLVAQALADKDRPRFIYRLPDAPSVPNIDSTTIVDVAGLMRRPNVPSLIHVVGFGLASHELDHLGNVRLAFTPAPLPLGFGHVDAPLRATLGRPFQLAARLVGPWSADDTSAVLIEPDGTTHRASPSSTGHVRFTTTPKATGPVRYHLELQGEGDQPLARETLGVFIEPPKKAGVLILDPAPNADTRFLRDALLADAMPFLIRTRLSKNHYQWQASGRDEVQFRALDPDLLASVQLVITGQRELQQLTPSERNILRDAVRDEGLGLLVRPDAIGETDASATGRIFADWGQPLSWQALDLDGSRSVRPFLADNAHTLSTITADPLSFTPTTAQRCFIEDRMGRCLALIAPLGKGRIASTAIFQSSAWVLRGEADQHRRYWQTMLEQVAQPVVVAARWHVAGPDDTPPAVDQPVILRLVSQHSQPPQVYQSTTDGTQVQLPMAGSLDDPYRWQTITWPWTAGWQQLQVDDSDTFAFYVGNAEDWARARQARKQHQTAAAAATSLPPATRAPGHVKLPLPRWPFAATLAIALTALWALRQRSKSTNT